MHQENFLK